MCVVVVYFTCVSKETGTGSQRSDHICHRTCTPVCTLAHFFFSSSSCLLAPKGIEQDPGYGGGSLGPVKDFCVARFLHIGMIEGTKLAKINLE